MIQEENKADTGIQETIENMIIDNWTKATDLEQL